MHIRNRRPVFVPEQFHFELEQLSKAALMDMVWYYSSVQIESIFSKKIMTEVRATAKVIKAARRRALKYLR